MHGAVEPAEAATPWPAAGNAGSGSGGGAARAAGLLHGGAGAGVPVRGRVAGIPPAGPAAAVAAAVPAAARRNPSALGPSPASTSWSTH